MEHTADAYVEASGRTLEEVFEWMAKGMFEIITDTNLVEPRIKYELSGEGVDLMGALYRWLEDLLIIHDAECMLFSRFKVHQVREVNEGVRYEASAWGERADPARHVFRNEVKAVTYSLMEIRKVNDCWIARVVFDL